MEAKNIQLNICYSCMNSMPEGSSICPACGNNNNVRSNPENTLPEGTVLFRKYLVGKMIGRGGFGVTYIGYGAFWDCTGLMSITYNGTKAEWKAISKGSYWDKNTPNYTIHWTDGDIWRYFEIK